MRDSTGSQCRAFVTREELRQETACAIDRWKLRNTSQKHPKPKQLCSFSAQSRNVEFSTRSYLTPQRHPKPKNNVSSQGKVERLSSVQDGICALKKAHMRPTPSLRRVPNVAFETAPLLVCPTDDGPFSSFQGGSSSALSFLDPPVSLAEAATSIIFAQQKFCHDKHVFPRDKNMLLSRQARA